MALGSTKNVLVCAESAITVAPCPTGQAPATYDAYLVEPANSSFFDNIAQPDFSDAGTFFAIGFLVPMTFYVFSLGLGSVIGFIRRI